MLFWALIGGLAGWRTGSTVSGAVEKVRRTGETWGEAHVADSKWTPWATALVAAGAWSALAWRFDHDLTVAVFGLMVLWGIRVSVVDIDTHVVTNSSIARAVVWSVPVLWCAALVDEAGSVRGMLLGSFGVFVVMKVLQVLSRGDLGGGDVRLGAVFALYAGWTGTVNAFGMLVAGFIAAGLVAIALLALRRAGRRSFVPFGPFLFLGTLVAVLR